MRGYNLQVQEGENFIIYCFADPKAEISWTKDGSPLRHWSAWQGYSVSDYHVQDFKISRLEVQAADADFSGGYSCSSESLAKHFVQVTALQDSNGAQTDCHVLVPNESLRLRCGIAAPDGENLTWFKDGEELFPDNDRFLAVGRTLEIRRTSEDDAGAYGCSRGRSAMNDSDGIAHVLQLVTPVRLEPLEGAVSAPLGARVNLECRAYARPDPQVTWLFGDRSRVSSPLLRVDNVSVSHSGTYRCSASHERCARLVAESDVTVNVFESTIRTNEGFPGSGITLTPGADSLRLLCDYPADRSAKIVWLKENATVPSGGKYSYDKKDQSLVIRKPERGDVGNYSCVALGRIVNETAVIVVGLKVEIHTSRSKHFKEGHDGFLSCKVDGYPTPTIRWYRNGHLLSAFKSSKFKYGGERADDYGTLVIRRLGKRDEATFACLVDNGHSQDRAFFPVIVSVPPSPLVPFFVICAEVALLTVVAFLFENHVRNAWMDARRMTAPQRERSQDRDAGRKRKSCTESDILRFISCLESSGDLDIDDLREPDPDEMPLTKRVDVAVNAEPVKSALLTRAKVMGVSAEPHVEFRPSENTVKVMVEPQEESAPEGVATVEVSPEEDKISPRKKSRKKKSRRRKSRLSKGDSIAASVQEDSLPQATAEKERVPKLSPVVEETLPMPVPDGEPLSEVSTVVEPATGQNEKPVSKASKVDKKSPATAQEQDVLPTAAQGKKLVPQAADVEAQKRKTIPRFTAIPIVEEPTGTKAKAKMNKDAELPAESALSRTKAKTKQTTKEPLTALPAKTSPCTEIVPLVEETEKPTPVRKGSAAIQGKDARKKVTASELAADNASRSSLEDFTYRKDSVSSRIEPSELLKDNTDRGSAVGQGVADGTKNFLFEEEPCDWKLPERRIVEYSEPGSVVLMNEGAVSVIPVAEGDALSRRGISFTHGTKQEDSSKKPLKRRRKKRKGWYKTQHEGAPLPGSPDERPLTFGVHTSTEKNEMMISIPLSKQRDEAEKSGLVECAEDTRVEGRLKGLERRDIKAAQALPVQEPIPLRPQEKPVSSLPESELILRGSRQVEPFAKKQEHKPFIMVPYKYDTESPSAPPSPEEVTVRGRRHSYVEPPVATKIPFPSRRKSDRRSQDASETESAKGSAKFAGKIGTSEEPEKKSPVPPTAQAKPTNFEAVLPKSAVAERTVPKKEQREKVDSPKGPSRRTSGQKVEPAQKIPGKLGPIAESPERALTESSPTKMTQPRQTLARRTSGQEDQPIQQKTGETPKPAVEGAPTGIIVATPPRQTVSRRTSGEDPWPLPKKEPEITRAPLEVPESSLKERVPTEKNVVSRPEQTLSRRTSERMVEPIKKTLPPAVSKGTLAESSPTKAISATPARKSSDQKSYKEVTRAPEEMGPPVDLPARVVGDSTSAERTSSDGTVSHDTESKLQEAPSRRTSVSAKSMTPEKAGHLVEAQDRAVSEGPFSERPVSSGTEEVPSRRTSSDTGDTVKSKTPEKAWHLVEAKDSTMTERPSAESAVSESAVTEVKPPVAAQRTLRKRSSPEEHALAEKGTRDVSERRKSDDSMTHITQSDSTAVIKKSTEPESSVRTEGEERRAAEADDRSVASKLESRSTEEEQHVSEEQTHEGLQVPDYQRTLSPSEIEDEPPMPSDLFNSSASPELDWTQDPDNFYYLSIPPFEFAIPRSHVDAPVGGSPPETGAKIGKGRHRSSRRRRNQLSPKSSTHDGSSSGTFTPSTAPEAAVDSLGQSSADISGQAGEDRASTSRDEPSRREEQTSSQNRRVKRHKSRTRQQKK
ncbi:hypothetical protein MTO96_002083 [Rhipicephalus appendiculatus]